jgi:glutamyl/glutaminyl-tRNA synthetase
MGITHVIRGEDHLTNTARQILIYKALGWTPPKFAHLPLLLGPDRKVLSKRHGATSLRELRKMGILPQALANYLFNLGGGTGEEVMDFEEMIRAFEIQKIERSQPVFDFKKLLWFNREHLKKADPSNLLSLDGELEPRSVELFKDEVKTLSELKELILSLKEDPVLEGLKDELKKEVLNSAFQELEKGKEGWLRRVAEKGPFSSREVFLSLRLALTGKRQGPSLEKVISYLDEETIRRRLERALALGG